MDDRRTISLALGPGERRQMLVEAGSTVLVVSGRISLRQPACWLAETSHLPDSRLVPEQVQVIESGGWIELQAAEGGQVVLIPPDMLSLWRKVGRCLDAMLSSKLGGPTERALERGAGD